MNLNYIPLLRKQRELQGLPRNLDRFKSYLRTLSADGEMLDLPPLGIMNPMGQEHVTALLDDYLAMDADGIATRAVAEAAAEVNDEPGEFKVALVIADDLKGGWTNRYDYEFNLRFGDWPALRENKPKWLKDYWLTAILWSSEPASERAVRDSLRSVVHRTAYVQQHGPARTLHEMMIQEGEVLTRTGCIVPTLTPEELTVTREIITPLLDEGDKRTAIECLFGDAAGETLGFDPRGLRPWAGLALAVNNVYCL